MHIKAFLFTFLALVVLSVSAAAVQPAPTPVELEIRATSAKTSVHDAVISLASALAPPVAKLNVQFAKAKTVAAATTTKAVAPRLLGDNFPGLQYLLLSTIFCLITNQQCGPFAGRDVAGPMPLPASVRAASSTTDLISLPFAKGLTAAPGSVPVDGPLSTAVNQIGTALTSVLKGLGDPGLALAFFIAAFGSATGFNQYLDKLAQAVDGLFGSFDKVLVGGLDSAMSSKQQAALKEATAAVRARAAGL